MNKSITQANQNDKQISKSSLRKFTVGINGLEFTLDAQIKYLA